MAIHSSILAWRIPWTEEPGRLQSIELQSWTHLKILNTSTHTPKRKFMFTRDVQYARHFTSDLPILKTPLLDGMTTL